MINTEMLGRDFFMCTTRPNGRQSFTHHVVTNPDRFLAAKAVEASKEREQPVTVRAATEDEYRDGNGMKRILRSA